MRREIKPSDVQGPATASGAADIGLSAPGRVSVCLGSVRVALAADWAGARELLAAHITATYAMFGRTDRADRYREDELARAALAPVNSGYLVTSAPGIVGRLNSLCRGRRAGTHHG